MRVHHVTEHGKCAFGHVLARRMRIRSAGERSKPAIGPVGYQGSPFRSWPSPPPTSGNPSADCVGIIADATEFALWLSDHILGNTGRVLEDLFKWERPKAEAYLEVLSRVADHSGGGVLEDVPVRSASTRTMRTTWC